MSSSGLQALRVKEERNVHVRKVKRYLLLSPNTDICLNVFNYRAIVGNNESTKTLKNKKMCMKRKKLCAG